MSEIIKTIKLLKRSYKQPIIFHILHSHLSFIISKDKRFVLYDYYDDWTKLLILSASDLKFSVYNLEKKIINFLVENRNTKYFDELILFKLKIILYYILNTQQKSTNMFILFELMNNYVDASEETDYYIFSCVSKHVMCNIFGIKLFKFVQKDAINIFLEKCLKNNSNFLLKSRILPAFIDSNIIPVSFIDFNSDDSLLNLNIFESLCLYAKFTANPSNFKEIIPSSPEFIEIFSLFISKEISDQSTEIKEYNFKEYNLNECLLNNNSLIPFLKNLYNKTEDKDKFISDLKGFIDSVLL
ncbi:hypothetical protein CWI39_0132p0040 [Hamiltosporidium magnivora]|uniref:Uncharacterized protein n=1 Tax=Hamiltosporidium magnivora TaxID=148818 RepID=A0A4Q9LLR1_9MICR|nr:hypothetical protein CWI39_0132p0040 [Hamiltosporidium magnivora]